MESPAPPTLFALHLKFDDALFYSVLDDEAGRVDGLELPEAMRTVDGLHLGRRVPPPKPQYVIRDTWRGMRDV